MGLTKEEEERRDAYVAHNAEIVNFEGPLPVPDAPNKAIPRAVWHKMQALGPKAFERLQQMIEHDDFHKMKPADRLATIQLALDQAYPKETVQKHLHLNVAPPGGEGAIIEGNALTLLSRNARAHLPEFSRKRLANVNRRNQPIDPD